MLRIQEEVGEQKPFEIVHTTSEGIPSDVVSYKTKDEAERGLQCMTATIMRLVDETPDELATAA